MAEKIGYVNSRIILSVLYFTLILPFSVAVRLFSDPLRIKKIHSSTWVSVDKKVYSFEHSRRQF